MAAVLLHYPSSQTSETTIEPRRGLGTGQWEKCACLVQVQSQHHTHTHKRSGPWWLMLVSQHLKRLKQDCWMK